MDALVYSTINSLLRLTTMVTAVPFIATHLKLYQNDFTPNDNSILADFTEATFGGYAPMAITFAAPGLDQSQTPVAPAPFLFTADGTLAGQAFGAYLLDSTGKLVCGGRFGAAPYNFAHAGDQLAGTLLFGMENGSVTVAVGP